MDSKRKRTTAHKNSVHSMGPSPARAQGRKRRVSKCWSDRRSAGKLAKNNARRRQKCETWRARPFTLARFGVLDEIAEKNKIMLDFDYKTLPGVSSQGHRVSGLFLGNGFYSDPRTAYRARIRGPNITAMFSALRIVGLRAENYCYRRTRKGWHVIVRVQLRRRLTPAEIVALQFCLGSDGRRETLNLMRVLSLRSASSSGMPLDGSEKTKGKRAGKVRFSDARWNLLFREKIA